MPNIRFGFRNIFDQATLSASPTFSTSVPVQNLQKQPRFKVARSTSAATQALRAYWASGQQRINYMHLRMHNLQASSGASALLFSDFNFTTLVGTIGFYNPFAYTGFSRNDIQTEADFRLLKNSTLYFPLRTDVQSVQWQLQDASNPDGYIEASRWFGGEYFEMQYNPPDGGVGFLYEDFSTQDMAQDGSTFSNKGPKRRVLDLNCDWCPASQWAELLAGIRHVGKDKDLFVSVYPEDGTYLEAYHQGIFKVADVSVFDRHFYGFAQQTIKLIES
jgi:hypothetical protein